ncbi:uncharacterized protein LOC143229113 isoform X2 [Tachypleus tridentatus]|uniref:uncharacterized protein LOC143229113 isoform X2 n=1 Tax=Tachypleus tridentatus TaxID=6853 RepID=UPI003FD51062
MFTEIRIAMSILPHTGAVLTFLLLSAGANGFILRSGGDPDFEAYLREVLENFRNTMEYGIPPIGVPPLEPLTLRNIDINVKEDVADVDLKFYELKIEGLSKFVVDKMESNLASYYADIGLSLPHLVVTGQYYLAGKVIGIFPLKGEGDYQIIAEGIYIGGMGQLVFNGQDLQFNELNLGLSWDELKVNLENFLGGGEWSKLIQVLLPAVGKGVFDRFKPKVMELLNKALMNKVNEELRKPDVKEIIKGIFPDKFLT